MIIPFCLYDLDTGRILTTGTCDDSTLQDQVRTPGQGVLQIDPGVFPRDWYVDIKAHPIAAVLRPEFTGLLDKTSISPDGRDAATLSALPNPSIVTVMGKLRQDKTNVTDGTLTITSAAAGRLSIYVDAFPAKLFQATIFAA
jgi:hypothetical protein